MNKRFRSYLRPAAGLAVLAAATAAKAENPASAAITSAQTDALAVVGALTALGVAVWGANYIRKKFFP